MQSGEDRLPPKRRLPRAFRTCVGDDVKARSFCPINGTRLTGQVKRKAEVEAEALRFEEDQDRGDQGTGSKRKKTKAEETSSVSSMPPPSLADASTILHPSTTRTLPAVPATLDASVQEGAHYYTWSIHDPPSTPAVAVAPHSQTAPACVESQPSCRKPPVSTLPHGQHAVCTNKTVFHIASQPPHATTPKPSSGPSATDAKGKNCAETAFPVTPVATTEHGGHSTSSLPPPSSQTIDVTVSSLSSRAAPGLSGAQEDQDSVDLFNAVYQSFFIPRSLDDRGPSTQEPAPVPSRPCADTPPTVDGERTPQVFSTSAATQTTDETISAASHHNAAERFPRDMCESSAQEQSTRLEYGYSAPCTPLNDVAHVYRERSADIGRSSTSGYAYQLQPGVPEPTYTVMHPVPPTSQSSYSELAGAMQYRERVSADDYTPPRAYRWATIPRAMGSAVPAIAFYTQPSQWALGINSPNQLPSRYPEEDFIGEGQFMRCFQEYPDDSEHSFLELASIFARRRTTTSGIF